MCRYYKKSYASHPLVTSTAKIHHPSIWTWRRTFLLAGHYPSECAVAKIRRGNYYPGLPRAGKRASIMNALVYLDIGLFFLSSDISQLRARVRLAGTIHILCAKAGKLRPEILAIQTIQPWECPWVFFHMSSFNTC